MEQTKVTPTDSTRMTHYGGNTYVTSVIMT